MSTKYRFIPFIALLSASLLLVGCDGDPEDDDDIIDLDEIVDFSLDNFTELTTSEDLEGVWVAYGTGTFSRDDGGDAKYGDQAALVYFVVKASGSGYEYANCFDTGTLEGDYDRGGYEPLTVSSNTVIFDSVNDDVDDDDDNIDDKLSDEDDFSNTGTLSGFSEINSTFTFDDGDSREVNTFRMIKVSSTITDLIGVADFYVSDGSGGDDDQLSCLAQWGGSYDTTEGLYQVVKYDASFDDAQTPFTTADYDSDDDDTEKEFSSISYKHGGVSVSGNTESDDEINVFLYPNFLAFASTKNGSTTDYSGTLTVNHADLVGR